MMRRRRNRSFFISFIVIAVLFTSLGYGIGYYRFGRSINNNINNETAEHLKTEENIDTNEDDQDSTDEQIVTNMAESIDENTNLVLRTSYLRCGSTQEEMLLVENNMIGLKEEELIVYFKNIYDSFSIESFSKEEVIIYREDKNICPNHFLVTEENGYIIVYKFNENGEKIKFKETQASIARLPLKDQSLLKEGIVKSSIDEVHQLLEDYSS
ncbi:hypothetical protein RH915_00990 [Serpentinicella sp. ANB-PHB4]|uniref:hypothetical protein n=1 Tax=Serpentinicella sp. ANB-PHB4 TaxID=3074076 RepID=UPI002862B63C|nr:hypothetical protein [Serpentinicella sp. ANB-PHB4]MDR5658054.1 hypothetical protein [Serpentinicella sp. ANB-PHB4]